METGDGKRQEGRRMNRVVMTEGGPMEESGGTMVDQREGGARMGTGGTWSRMSQTGPRLQPT